MAKIVAGLWICLLAVGLQPGTGFAQNQPTPPAPPTAPPETPSETQDTPPQPPATSQDPASTSPTQTASQPTFSPFSRLPFMLGDLLGATRNVSFPYNLAGDVAGTEANGTLLLRNTKIAENNSALPRDRVSVRYHWFHNGASITGLEPFGPRTRGVISAFDVGLQGLPPGLQLPSSVQFLPPDPDFGQFMFTIPNRDLDQLRDVFPPVGLGVVDGFGVRLDPGSNFQGTAVRRNDDPDLNTDPESSVFDLVRVLRNQAVRPASRDYDVHRTNLGIEKTFLGGTASWQVRIPVVQSINSDLNLAASQEVNDPFTRSFLVSPFDGALGGSDAELKDIQLIVKGLIGKSERVAVSAGMGVTVPTAEDVQVGIVDGFPDPTFRVTPVGVAPLADVFRRRDVEIQNESVALSPFLAMAAIPNEDFFFNGFFQLDFPVGQDSVEVRQTNFSRFVIIDGTARSAFTSVSESTGKVRDQMLMHLDLGGGYWFYRNRRANFLTGLAGLAELHWTSTLQDADVFEAQSTFLGQPVLLAKRQGNNTVEPVVPEPALQIGNTANRMDILNATLGMTMIFNERATLTLGSSLPLRNENDKLFDVEAQVQFNYLFGPQPGSNLSLLP